MRHVVGVLWHPRKTMTEVVRQPAYVVAWVVLLAVLAVCAFTLLSTSVGRQALVDERVRVIEALGGRVDDPAYAALQANPPWLVYLTSGGRLLLTPEITLLVALGLMALASLDGVKVRYGVALAVTVHASAVLALQQVIATPLHFVRESLTSPTNIAGVLPLLEEGSLPARWLGSIDLFGLWWIWLLAVGLAAATGRPASLDESRPSTSLGTTLSLSKGRDSAGRSGSARRYFVRLLVAYVGVAALVAAVFAVIGAQSGGFVFRRKWLLIVIALLLVGGGTGAYFATRAEPGVLVTAEGIQKRDLESIVSASGKIEPKKTVNISAQTMGRVTRLGVQEGDRVKTGQFLLQIDPVNAEASVRRDEAAVMGAMTGLEQSKASLQSSRAALENARQSLKRQQELSAAGLTTRESLEKAQTDVEMRESDLKAREQEIKNRETQLNQQQAGLAASRHTLTQVRFEAPFDGIVTRRNIEEGENVMVGTMNNAGTVLLTVADMSVIEAEVEVDETDIPLVQMGQKAKVTIDAMPDKEFTGTVTEIGNSPIQTAGTGTTRTATNFKVVVTIDGQIPEVRPGFTCTAEITTATRKQAVAVPIQSLTVRELVYDAQGNVVHETRPPKTGFQFQFGPAAAPAPTAAARELKPGEKREEVEGVFLMSADKKANFVQVKVGIAGERYLEVLSGLKEGDQVITGPFDSVRTLYEADLVRTAPPPKPQQ